MRDLITNYKDNCGFGLLANINNIPTHDNVEDAIQALERMMHRGAVAADGKTGDGSGLLFSLPTEFMKKEAKVLGVDLPKQFAVSMVFLQNDKQKRVFEEICEKNDLKVVLYRDVPINIKALGKQALDSLPEIVQIFVTPSSLIATKRFEALLYLTRREIDAALKEDKDFYISSFSNKVVSYKGLIMPTHIKTFYLDLSDKDFKTTFALFHQRFSTNTLPQWKLAQPFRSIAHNGEINSIESNRFHTKMKSECLKSGVYSDKELAKLLPITDNDRSDSASLDNVFEFMITNGYDFFKAARTLIQAPWQNSPHMDSDLRAFYEYASISFEPWDGPAAVSMTDGRYIGCILDRNGLRPAKYVITKDERIIISSEYGVIDIEEENILERGRLQSGQMIGIDLKFGKVMKSNEIDDYLKSSNRYADWLNNNLVYLQEFVEIPFSETSDYKRDKLVYEQRFFNVTQEVKDMVLTPMLKDGKEGVGSMGDDTPMAAFSSKQRNFSDYFKQKFAQVTNPPIDPIREKVVMSLTAGFGEMRNILDESSEHAKRIKSISPILMQEKLEVLMSFGDPSKPRYSDDYKQKVFSTLFEDNLKGSLEDLVYDVIDSVKNQKIKNIFLDDRGMNNRLKPIPMLMVMGRLNQALLQEGIRHKASIIAISGEIFDSHSCATLIGFGASAVYPYILYASALEECKNMEMTSYETKTALKNVNSALNQGLLKIMSKMGIATLASYRSSSLFDCLGLSNEIIEDCFCDSYGMIPGLGYDDIEERLKINHQKAYELDLTKKLFPLEIGGFYKHIDGSEFHDFEPAVVHAIHKLSSTGEKEDYDCYKNLVNGRGLKFIRDFFDLKSDRKPIDISLVESKEEIFKRFASAAMSLGSISPEAHEALAEAMNKIGGMSNSGEGGESPERLKTNKISKIKQVASGRFGVTPEYLRSATEIQIKVAQGAKPGEGGQLPGYKVTPLIASLRYTIPGVTLISPPPHHDIYSIEDLAQLIYDLKQVNPEAIITVKLVSTAGVGTIAAGVAKAYADKIIISGGDGGTGAAPLTSIKFAGNPWELGLSEAHNALKANHLRDSVHVQTDGGLKTGLDVVKAALLGAESYAFGTVALTVIGCKILRICHQNRCSVGVATQDKKLREHFVGTVDKIVNFFTLVAEDVREILAELGYESLEEIIGRSDFLNVKDDEFAKKFDFSSVLMNIDGINTCRKSSNDPFDPNDYEHGILKEIYKVIENPEEKIVIRKKIQNTNRSFGALVSGEIAKYYGNKGLAEDSIKFELSGVAGQSFGAFLANGIKIRLYGTANDYIGKGMNGGKIVIIPKYQKNGYTSGGNTCLYGATGGKLFIAGEVGERFCVRNSGATTVVEGTGDHACEYMTGGVVTILGNTGVNFGAGMTGGIAFVYDMSHDFIDKLNQELVVAERIDTDDMDEARHFLKRLLRAHVNETESKKAIYILENFRHAVRNFWIVRPKDMTKTPLNPDEGD
ncbi:glutamate synthase large subunit [Sulfurospirillum arcachonense]|uniref:glutamate synthase large subunit n=1 Tax=Sulfurospirillum arcachonense TaxID=57666 RepID=UPI000469709E|nr:glutamate synthase large subunit [Sulfurospirillum arcachonense]